MTAPSEAPRAGTEGAAIQRILDFSTAIERGEEPWREGVQEISRIALEARRALADAPAGDGWSPDMDAAPKDGSEFLAFARDPNSRDFYGVAQWAEKRDYNPRSVAGWFWPFAIRPTHWRRLPSPPADQNGGDRNE